MIPAAGVALIDDDRDVLDALTLYLRSEGIEVSPFNSANGFLEALAGGSGFDVVTSDVRMPEMNGLELQAQLRSAGIEVPLILITGHGDIQMAVGAVKAGAFDFIEKPFNETLLKQRIDEALRRSYEGAESRREIDALHARIAELSPRQLQVMHLAVTGATNKEIALELAISPRTVEDYRAWVMQRLGARNLAELVRLVTWLGRENSSYSIA